MAEGDFVLAVPPGGGDKRLVPKHYIDNPAFGFKLPPSASSDEAPEVSYSTEQNKVYEPVLVSDDAEVVREPAVADSTGETVEEPAAATTKTSKRSGAAGES